MKGSEVFDVTREAANLKQLIFFPGRFSPHIPKAMKAYLIANQWHMRTRKIGLMIRDYENPLVSLSKALLGAHFFGVWHGGGTLNSHENNVPPNRIHGTDIPMLGRTKLNANVKVILGALFGLVI